MFRPDENLNLIVPIFVSIIGYVIASIMYWAFISDQLQFGELRKTALAIFTYICATFLYILIFLVLFG